jgi:hypothetical protein|tara:strand:- start:136 stop:648 length:513 start_codon:yes stop_codon:yes gene_type:complete
MKIFTHAIPRDDFNDLELALKGPHYPWFYQNYINFEPDKENFCFQNTIIKNSNVENKLLNINYIKTFHVLLEKINFLEEDVSMKLNCAKAEMLLRNEKEILIPIIHHKLFSQIGIYFISENNGGIQFENKQFIKSEKNKLVMFDSSEKYSFKTCSDDKNLIFISVEYEKI